jgi:hypothetical protein
MDGIYISIALLFICGFALGVCVQNIWDVPALLSKSFQDKQVINNFTCDNQTGANQVGCMVKYVKTFFNYTIRTDIPRTFEDIKENGGDCYDYTMLYVNMAKEKGLLAKKVDLFPTEENSSGHAYATIWDKNLTFYCDVDMLDYHCSYFG